MLWRDPRRVIDGALAMDPRVTRPLRFLLIVLAATSLPLLLLGDGTVASGGGTSFAAVWQKLHVARSSGISFANNLGWITGSVIGITVRDYPHVSLVLCAPMLAFGLSWAFRAQRAGYAVALVAATYALGVLYPLAFGARLLAGRVAAPAALVPIVVAALWWFWFTRSVYRCGWLATLVRAALVPALTLIGAVLVMLVLVVVIAALAMVL